MVITLILFTIANIVLASIDARKIIDGDKIKHGINGLIYIAMISATFLIFHNFFLIGALLFNRLLAFNIALSVFRKLPWDYVTPENPPKSIVDRIAKMVFGMNGKLMYIIYAVIFALLTILSIAL